MAARAHLSTRTPSVPMKAIHGGKAKNDKSDSQKSAALLRGGLLPQAYVYPAAMRSTRDLLRRRLHVVRKRGELLGHIQNTRAQYQLPEFGRRLAYPANRAGVSEHFPDPSVRKSIDVDLALLERYDGLITDLELTIVREAKRHDGDAFHRLRSVPGIGKVVALTILYEIHDIARFDRVQAFASYARLVKMHRGERSCWRRSRRSTAKGRRCRCSPTKVGERAALCCRVARCSPWRNSARRSGEESGRARRLTRARRDRARGDRAARVRRQRHEPSIMSQRSGSARA